MACCGFGVSLDFSHAFDCVSGKLVQLVLTRFCRLLFKNGVACSAIESGLTMEDMLLALRCRVTQVSRRGILPLRWH